MSGQQDERPWYRAITASALFHICVIIAVSGMVVSTRTSSRRSDFVEANIALGDAADTMSFTSTPLLEIAAPNEAGGGGNTTNKTHGPGDGAPLLNEANPSSARQSPIPLHLAATGRPLTSNWLTELRSGNGLTDVVGPVVYGTDGNPEGHGRPGAAEEGSGNGSGGGFKSNFFGIRGAGRRIVYLVDASNSMNRPYEGEGKTRFGQMKLELAKSILALTEEQQFFIIFFNEHPNPMPSAGLEIAFPQNQQRFLDWMIDVRANGFTDPRPALNLALSMNPDVIYLLTDGMFPRDVNLDLINLRQPTVQINTIAFGDQRGEKLLKPLAVHNHGHFAFVP